jgi:hypothetical protein
MSCAAAADVFDDVSTQTQLQNTAGSEAALLSTCNALLIVCALPWCAVLCSDLHQDLGPGEQVSR